MPVGSWQTALPADDFLARVTTAAASLKGVRVERPSQSNALLVTRRTPTWAVVLALAGLLVMLLGLLFLLVKQTETVSVLAVDDGSGGCTVTITGSGPGAVAFMLNRELDAAGDGREGR